MSQWISKIEVLSQIAKVEPQAAYCCFTTGFKHKLTYLMHATPNINEELRRLGDVINNKLIPSFTENKSCRTMNNFYYHYQLNLREWVYLFFSEFANIEFQNSSLLTKEHVSLIARQETAYGIQKEAIKKIKKKIKRDR